MRNIVIEDVKFHCLVLFLFDLSIQIKLKLKINEIFYIKPDTDRFVSVGHAQFKLVYHSRHVSKSPSYDDSPVLFLCQECKNRLSTKWYGCDDT